MLARRGGITSQKEKGSGWYSKIGTNKVLWKWSREKEMRNTNYLTLLINT